MDKTKFPESDQRELVEALRGVFDKTQDRLRAYLLECVDRGIDIDNPDQDYETTPEYMQPFVSDFLEWMNREKSRRDKKPDKPEEDKLKAYRKEIMDQIYEFPTVESQIPPVPIRDVERHFAEEMEAVWNKVEFSTSIEELVSRRKKNDYFIS